MMFARFAQTFARFSQTFGLWRSVGLICPHIVQLWYAYILVLSWHIHWCLSFCKPLWFNWRILFTMTVMRRKSQTYRCSKHKAGCAFKNDPVQFITINLTLFSKADNKQQL